MIRNREEILHAITHLRPNRKAIIVDGVEEVTIARELEREGLADYKPAPVFEGHEAGYLFPSRGQA